MNNRPTFYIDGSNAVGKTTVSRYIAEQTDCTVIHGDAFFGNGMNKAQQAIFKRFGDFPRPGKVSEFFARYLTSPETIQGFLFDIRPFIEEDIIETRQKLSKNILTGIPKDATYNYHTNTNGWIIEFVTSSAFYEEWANADRRYVIFALLEKIVTNALERGRPDDSEEVVINKYNAEMPTIVKARNVNYTLINQQHFTESQFQTEADKTIIKDIMEIIY